MDNDAVCLVESTEAQIYLSEPHEGYKIITKLYHSNISYAKKVSEFTFLSDHQNAGYVPILYSEIKHVRKDNFINMEYLEGYITLASFKKYLTSATIKTNLCDELIKGRRSIGENIHYSDLHKKNVMVKITGDTINVKFIDPGQSTKYYDVWKSWCMDIARELSVAKIMKKCIQKK